MPLVLYLANGSKGWGNGRQGKVSFALVLFGFGLVLVLISEDYLLRGVRNLDLTSLRKLRSSGSRGWRSLVDAKDHTAKMERFFLP